MLNPVIRRAIADRQPPRIRGMKSGDASVEVTVRLTVDPLRIKNIGGRERQINLTKREQTCLDPVQVTLFGSKERRRKVRLILNKRRANLLSITSTGILVFTYKKVW